MSTVVHVCDVELTPEGQARWDEKVAEVKKLFASVSPELLAGVEHPEPQGLKRPNGSLELFVSLRKVSGLRATIPAGEWREKAKEMPHGKRKHC